jgi:tRNA threonylcarbamoyladenosine biosynthesis protein TsaE
MADAVELVLTGEAATLALGARLAPLLRPGMVIFLHGNLGTGKTTLVRGMLRGLGFLAAVKSPTYTLVEPYQIAGNRIHHFDLYRLVDPMELEEMGIRDYLGGDSICLVEWPERGSPVLSAHDLDIALGLSTESADGRTARLSAASPRGEQMLRLLTAGA